jgi:hypothetical protein
MRQVTNPLTFLFCLFIQSCSGQIQQTEISLHDLSFSSIFGNNEKDSLHTYCLLGRGYFRTPRSDDSDSLINVWLTLHPNAKVISVSTHGPTMADYPESKLTYCWLVDGNDTINNYLVKNGCFPGGTMMRPETYEEMSKEMKEVYKDLPKPKIIVHLDKKSYDNFIEQIKIAEAFAEQNNLGIWKKKSSND